MRYYLLFTKYLKLRYEMQVHSLQWNIDTSNLIAIFTMLLRGYEIPRKLNENNIPMDPTNIKRALEG